jgi:hypothetical protein
MTNPKTMAIVSLFTLAALSSVAVLVSVNVAFSFQIPAVLPDKAVIGDLKWLAGHWRGEVEGRTTEESWLAPEGGMMLAVNRSISKTGHGSFEFLRIAETPDGLVYFASPSGQPPTQFPLKSLVKNEIIFENLKHDFPQRIIYRRSGDRLTGRIEGMRNGRQHSIEWIWSMQDGR